MHSDIFDWTMIAQAKEDWLQYVTHDSKILLYKEDCAIFV